jgi:hypothetical protein
MFRNLTYRHVLGGSFVIASLVGYIIISGPSILAENLAEDPIAYIGHGVMFDRNGKRIEPTLEFIAKAQTVYRKFLSELLPDQQRQLFESKSKNLLAGADFDEQSRLVANSSLIDWELKNIDTARVENLGRLAAKNNFLKWLLRSQLTPADQPIKSPKKFINEPETFKMSALLQNRLDEAGLGEADLESTTQSGAYIEECRNAGVPIPPDWDRKKWDSKGFLSTNFLGSASTPAEVFVAPSTSPPGVSIALPRYTSPEMKKIDLLGIISLGQASSKACFWDNQENKVGFIISKNETVPLSRFAGGAQLFGGSGNICTDCHAGENPFIIHPNTALGLPNLAGLLLFARDWYQPLVHPNWPQNPGPLVGTTGVCSDGCHKAGGQGGRFPQVSSIIPQYCGTVLGNAIKFTMPSPGAPANGPDADPSYKAHADALLAVCSMPPAPGDGTGTEADIGEIMESILLPLR